MGFMEIVLPLVVSFVITAALLPEITRSPESGRESSTFPSASSTR